MSEEIIVQVDQRWVNDKDGRTIRIMAIAEKYVMVRYKGGFPLVLPIQDLYLKFKLNPQSNGKKKSSTDK
jgi:hypothetical protein